MWPIGRATRVIAERWKRRVVVAFVLGLAGIVWRNTAAEPIGGIGRREQPASNQAALTAPERALQEADRSLQENVHRLHRNLKAVARVQQSTRNPFAWGASGGAPEPPATTGLSPTAVSAPPIPPTTVPFRLIGIAENRTAAGPERFAILAWNDEAVIAAEGARVGGRYLVRRIDAGAIDVIDAATAAAIRLTLEDH